MGDIPLMRAGLCIMAVIAAVGGLSLVVLPEEGKKNGKKGNGDGDGDGDRVAVVAPVRDTAVPPAMAAVLGDSSAAFSCRQDTAGIQLPAAVHESSGLALAGDRDALWTHNDSDQPLLYRVGLDGRLLNQVTVSGARVEDWEDVAAGPCSGGRRCLYVADIGDNKAKRPNITIYRVPEPAPGEVPAALPADGLVAAYPRPDGPQDAEALFVLPDGAVYIVTKGETGPVNIYELSRTARPGPISTLRRVAQLNADKVERPERITGAAASPDGKWFALRTLHEISFYPTGSLSAERLPAPLTFDLRALGEPQGEAVEFGRDGVIHLSSEGGKKSVPATLSRLTCTLPAS